MIEITNLKKSYEGLVVLEDISLSIKKGDIFGIIGYSGAGKSTLLRCINGIESYESGSIKVDDKYIETLNYKDLRIARKDFGMIFQNFNLLSRKTVYENIALPLETWGYSKDLINKRVYELLDLVSLTNKAHVKPSKLSGGQKQRIAIARALALEPKILLCDEATSALDPKTTKDILSLLNKLNKDLGITIAIVTHQMEVIKEICNSVALIDSGKLLYNGSVEDLFLKPDSSLNTFIGDEDLPIKLQGINIKLFFPKESSSKSIITSMARDLDKDFSIIEGKVERFRDSLLGTLTININDDDKDIILKYLDKNNISWEVRD
ncbi:methionine ABC transporter ATP-binding protein [Clostridium algidicarnis]|uniref:methionine ABC transporter ATP-binding protein n=1 Tax=Clostridium algidicarnis TaxID=37659 RepID=UPI001C0A9E7D|nr:methionine ABC transporter ATP-binding protein [Clostridium algidicarnis]MBU3228680.1 methionine ABC transporter ATP-binding protein [Clostridium algidicarnis]MBU3251274.1 methionine ABC transporter ATP-binding protein [Clostridium algidicarnis]